MPERAGLPPDDVDVEAPETAEPEQVGRCDWCGEGIWLDTSPDYVRASGWRYHRGCAESLLTQLQAQL